MALPDSRPATGRIRVFDQPRAEAAIRELLCAIGEDPDRNGLQETPARTKGIAGIGDVDINLEDLYFQHIAGLGFFDSYRAGKYVAAGAFLGHMFANITVVCRNRIFRHSGLFKPLQRAG